MEKPFTEPTVPLMDSFKRQIDYLRVSITDRCNLKCMYCIPDRRVKYFDQSEILTSEEITRFVRVAHRYGVRKVRITGGEPLMRDNMVSLISSIKELGIHDLSITTNGIILTRMAGALKRAGLDRVNISLDTLDSSKYKIITRGGNIYRVWEAIEEAERVGLYPIKINVVLIRGVNDDEILKFASLTFDRDYHIRFIELMPVGYKGLWNQEVYVKKEEIINRISALGKLIPLEFRGDGPSRNYRIEGAKGVIGIISPISDHFCAFCNRLRLTAQGRIRPCIFSDTEIDIKTPLRKGVSDEELHSLFCHAVIAKPPGHSLNKNKNSFTDLISMSKIGG